MQQKARADDVVVRTVEAPRPHHFGDSGDVVLPVFGASFTNSFGGGVTGYSLGALTFAHASSVQSFERQEMTAVGFAPNLDFFIGRHVSLGGSVGVGYSELKITPVTYAPEGTVGIDNGAINVSLAPRIGYVFSLSDHVALWPRISVGAGGVVGLGGTGPMPINLAASTDLQVVYSIDRRFYVAVGPAFAVGGNPKYGIYDSSFATSLSGAFQAGFVL